MIGRLSQSCRETKRAIKKFVVDKLRSVTPVRLSLLSNGRRRGHLIDQANHAEAVFLRSSNKLPHEVARRTAIGLMVG